MNKKQIKSTWMAAVSIVMVSFFSACANQNPVAAQARTVGPGVTTGGTSPISSAANPIGVAVVKNFNSYFSAIRMCLQVQPSTATLTYLSQAELVLPSNTHAGSVNNAVVQSGVSLAGYLVNDFIVADLAKATGRLLLSSVPLSGTTKGVFSVTKGQTLTGLNVTTVFTPIVQAVIPLCYGRQATSSDTSAAITAATTALGTGTPTATTLEQAVLVVLTGILGAPPMLAANGI